MLLSLDEVQQGLAAKFSDALAKHPGRFATMVPRQGSARLAEEVAEGVQRELGEHLPDSFVDMLARWDLGHLEINGIVFCRKQDYVACLAAFNVDRPGLSWWEDGEADRRPAARLMIAQGDPHVFLLDLASGAIEAYASSEGAGTRKRVAAELESFLRAVGTVELMAPTFSSNLEAFVDKLVADLGGAVDHAFWAEIAQSSSAG